MRFHVKIARRMYNIKSTIIICVFVLGCVITLFFSRKIQVQTDQIANAAKPVKEKKFSEFSNINLYSVNDGKPSLELNSSYLDIIENIQMEFISPKGTVYSINNKDININFSASEGKYSFSSNLLELRERVHFQNAVNDIITDEMQFNTKSQTFNAKGNIVINSINVKTGDSVNVKAKKAKGDLSKKDFQYIGDVSGGLKRKRKYEPGLDFKAQKVDVKFSESLILMEGEVNIKRSKFDMLAGKAELYMENYNKTLKYYSLYDDIKLEEKLSLKDGAQIVRKAYADKIEGFNLERKLVLTGAPRVIQGSDVIKGYRVTLRENLEMVEVDDSASSFTIKKKEQN